MNFPKLSDSIVSMLKALDIFIEIQANAVHLYKTFAHETDSEGERALFAWLYNLEDTRLRRLNLRKRGILKEHADLISTGDYQPRKETGLSKMCEL